jgi:hypothetical protein
MPWNDSPDLNLLVVDERRQCSLRRWEYLAEKLAAPVEGKEQAWERYVKGMIPLPLEYRSSGGRTSAARLQGALRGEAGVREGARRPDGGLRPSRRAADDDGVTTKLGSAAARRRGESPRLANLLA